MDTAGISVVVEFPPKKEALEVCHSLRAAVGDMGDLLKTHSVEFRPENQWHMTIMRGRLAEGCAYNIFRFAESRFCSVFDKLSRCAGEFRGVEVDKNGIFRVRYSIYLEHPVLWRKTADAVGRITGQRSIVHEESWIAVGRLRNADQPLIENINSRLAALEISGGMCIYTMATVVCFRKKDFSRIAWSFQVPLRGEVTENGERFGTHRLVGASKSSREKSFDRGRWAVPCYSVRIDS